MQLLRDYLNQWKSRRALAALIKAGVLRERETDTALDMFKKDLISEKEYDARKKRIDKQFEEEMHRVREIEASQPQITDIPAIRYTLEALAWLVLYVGVLFALQPAWANRHTDQVLILGVGLGIAASYLRNNWGRN